MPKPAGGKKAVDFPRLQRQLPPSNRECIVESWGLEILSTLAKTVPAKEAGLAGLGEAQVGGRFFNVNG